jgi:ergothioneine biosynthesis protein EgtB
MTGHTATTQRVAAPAEAYCAVREWTEHLAACLSAEDQCIQSMPDASPVKWHRAHTTWFFEQFVLLPHEAGYAPFDETFGFLFNSYYDAVGARHPRPARGMLTRPSAEMVGRYRQHVDAAMARLLQAAPAAVHDLTVLGLQHEQQHQELLVTDILHALSQNPTDPAAIPHWQEPDCAAGPTGFITCPGGIALIGHGGAGFCFDNELPRHQTLLAPYSLASRLVRNGEFKAFIEDGGYRRPEFWMADGWECAHRSGWEAPLYWRRDDSGWTVLTPSGRVAVADTAPVRHISWYEADAFARWAGARLPTEAELEAGCRSVDEYHGYVWQWTASAYRPYPGYRPPTGAIGEYNGKFMINQMVLRGSSCATPPGHARHSYRNFFYPAQRWQFSGLRLARDI